MNRKKQLLRYLPVAIAVILIVIVGVVVYLFRDLFDKPIQAKKQVQQIAVIQPPPPPPPPEQPPPPPEIKEEKIEEPPPEPEPEEQAEEPPPGEELGVDADGGAGSDGFGLVGRKGGQGLLGGGGGSAIIYYGQQVGRALQSELQGLIADTPARSASYTITVSVWIGADGKLNRAEMAGTTGKREVDDALRQAVSRLRLSLQRLPPESMPQPIKVRVSSRS